MIIMMISNNNIKLHTNYQPFVYYNQLVKNVFYLYPVDFSSIF